MAGRFGLIARHRLKIAALATVVALSPLPRWGAQGTTLPVVDPMPVTSGLSVLTYNIEGLPWPLRLGRQDALDAMTQHLRALRAQGKQPHVVLLQEAFSDGARGIGQAAGYRHIVDGPASTSLNPAQPRSGDAAFLSDARWLKGEGQGKWAGSGLQILSDYPILSVTRAPFPQFACAGFDCLANKGMVAVTVAVPGMASPVAIIDLHLNSRKASGVEDARSFYAYRLQVDALEQFVARTVPAHMPLIISGDFNIGKSQERRAYVAAHLARFSDTGGPIADALTGCAADRQACPAGLSREAQRSLRRGKDWQYYRSGRDSALRVKQIAVPFGHAADGTMLSDHIGYTAYY